MTCWSGSVPTSEFLFLLCVVPLAPELARVHTDASIYSSLYCGHNYNIITSGNEPENIFRLQFLRDEILTGFVVKLCVGLLFFFET